MNPTDTTKTRDAIRTRLMEICHKVKDIAVAEAQKEETNDSDIEKAMWDFVQSQLEGFTREELIFALTIFEMKVIMSALTFAAHMTEVQKDKEQ